MKQKLFMTLMLLSVLVSACSAGSAAGTATPEAIPTVIADRTIIAEGRLEPARDAEIAFTASGVVSEVLVGEGEAVKTGQPLIRLGDASDTNYAAAQLELVSAQKALNDLLNTSGAELAQAVIDLKQAKEDFDKADDYLRYLENSKKVPQSQTKLFLETKRNSWMYVYKTKTFKGPAPEDWIIEAQNDLALKKGELQDAQRTYDRLKEGSNSQDVIAAQANVDAAQATVDSMSVIAPFDGEVLYVQSQPGDVVETGTSAANVADLDHLYVETQVDESDVAN